MSANDRDWLGLRDRVCVITGAASGIGRETAIQFATVGATVVAIDRDGNGCSQTAEEVQKQGGAALALECDVFEAESVSVAASRALATSRIALALTACPISSMKIRNRGHCNSSFEHRAYSREAIAHGDGHESSARSYFNHGSGDTVGHELSRAGGGPDFSDRGREQPARDRAVELVGPCKLARPDPGRIRVTSNSGIV